MKQGRIALIVQAEAILDQPTVSQAPAEPTLRHEQASLIGVYFCMLRLIEFSLNQLHPTAYELNACLLLSADEVICYVALLGQ